MAERKKIAESRRSVRKNVILLVTLGLFYFLAHPVSKAFGKEPEEIWKDLSKESMQERERQLLLEAKTERTVVFYANRRKGGLNLKDVTILARGTLPAAVPSFSASGMVDRDKIELVIDSGIEPGFADQRVDSDMLMDFSFAQNSRL